MDTKKYTTTTGGSEDECVSCAVTGQKTPATEIRDIAQGGYQCGIEITRVWLCAECARVHDEAEGIGDYDDR